MQLVRPASFLLVAASLGVFSALVGRPGAAPVPAAFVAGLLWFGALLVLAMRYPGARGSAVSAAALWLGGTGWLLHGLVPHADLARAGALLLFLWLVFQLRPRASGFTARRQADWLRAGLLLGVLSLFGLPVGAAAVLQVAVPVTVLLAIAKYRLVDADSIVRDAAIGIVLALPAAAVVWAVHRWVGRDPWLLVLVGLLLFGAWIAGRNMVRASLRARGPARAEDLADDIRRAEHLAHALARLCAALADLLAVHGARYLLHEGDGLLRPFSSAGGGAPTRLRAQGRLLAYTSVFGAPVPVDELRAEPLDEAEEALLATLPEGTELLVPCLAGDVMSGLLQIGPRRDGRPLDPRAYRALARLGERLGDLVDPLWMLDRQAAHLRAERALVDAARALTLATAARDVARRLRPSLSYVRNRAPLDDLAAQLLPELEVLTTDLVIAEAPGRRAPFDVAPWLDETAELLFSEAEIHLVSLEVESEDLRIEGDAHHLRLAVRLLAGNALEALAEWHGPRQITLSARKSDGMVHLAVADSGPPRTPAIDRPWSDPRGLRAATAARVARQHGGRLEITAAAEGVTARIALPSDRLA